MPAGLDDFSDSAGCAEVCDYRRIGNLVLCSRHGGNSVQRMQGTQGVGGKQQRAQSAPKRDETEGIGLLYVPSGATLA
jgi:hypothetical protein